MSIRKFVVTVSTVVVAVVLAFCGVVYFAYRDLPAQAQAPSAAGGRQSPPRQPTQAVPVPLPAPAPAAPASPAAPAASESVRTETITYGEWTVTCRYAATKACSAMLPMVVEQQNQRVNVGAWILAQNEQGALVSLLQTPQLNMGVMVNKGVELKLGAGEPLKIGYVACNPQRCEASMPWDEALTRQSIAAANSPASITFWKADGAEFTINIASIKGIDKAIAALR